MNVMQIEWIEHIKPGLFLGSRFRTFDATFFTDPAKIIILASEHEVAAQQSVSLQCIAEGNPEPAYSWTPCDPQQSVCHESTLKISEVLSDTVYSCNVTNSVGTDARNTSLGKLLPGNLRVIGYVVPYPKSWHPSLCRFCT